MEDRIDCCIIAVRVYYEEGRLVVEKAVSPQGCIFWTGRLGI